MSKKERRVNIMYRIIVAEDEPTALNHVLMILRKKCPEYEIQGTAENGREALELIRKEQPDILISDVKMPVMDGIQLVAKVKEEFPEVLSVIVSGYSEFEYAKGALQSGVCDYLLKPLAPSDMKKLMDKLMLRLNSMYYHRRNKILKKLCNGKHIEDKSLLYRCFAGGKYYAAIYRKNGLPKRFSRTSSVEIFSMEEERVYIYGRDEMEALYLFPEELLFSGGFRTMAERIFERERSPYTYLTAIIYEQPFELEELPDIVPKLYRKLDESVVTGQNQMYCLKERNSETSETDYAGESEKQLELIEYLIRYKENGKIFEELKTLFSIFEKQKESQIYVEASIRYIFQLMRNMNPLETDFADLEFMIDDAFYYAATMQELMESVLNIVKQCMPEMAKERIDNKEQLLHSICSYIEEHMGNPMTLGSICKQFGVSQTSLSRMFRTYKNSSFSNYLTKVRIEKAKQMMLTDPNAYIKDIAERVGYADQFYFSRIFRSVTGICPKEYIESAM